MILSQPLLPSLSANAQKLLGTTMVRRDGTGSATVTAVIEPDITHTTPRIEAVELDGERVTFSTLMRDYDARQAVGRTEAVTASMYTYRADNPRVILRKALLSSIGSIVLPAQSTKLANAA